MTIVCGWCRKEIREMCPHCGMAAAPIEFRWRFFLSDFRAALPLLALWIRYRHLVDRLFTCGGVCPQVLFLKGLGGVSHGICEECNTKTRFAQCSRERGVV
jgi:hypothetical protein